MMEEERIRADAAGPSRSLSRPVAAPWNTVGLPKPSSAVKRAVREIESRLQEERRNEEIYQRQEDIFTEPKQVEEAPNVTDIAKTRLMWQAREKGEPYQKPVEYRTDYYPDNQARGENVIILKLEEVPTVEKKDVTVQTSNVEVSETYKIESFFNYEKSWQDFRNIIWSSKAGKMGTINSDRVSSIESHIPRARQGNFCSACRKPIPTTHKYCDQHDFDGKTYKVFSIDPQRSRSNFFGNSNSYALRCNLLAVPQHPNVKRKMYLPPDPPKEAPKIYNGFETFQAKKRVFVRQKISRQITDTAPTRDMWY